MQTLVWGKQKQVRIDSEGVFTIIGEKINPTGRKKLAAALLEGNLDYVTELATTQINTGADLLDVIVGVPGAEGAGATCAITDPIKFTRVLRAVNLLRGKDTFAVRYVKY